MFDSAIDEFESKFFQVFIDMRIRLVECLKFLIAREWLGEVEGEGLGGHGQAQNPLVPDPGGTK